MMTIGRDKYLHFAAGFALSLIPEWGFLIAFVALAGKEVYDLVTGEGTCDVMDFVAGLIGMGAAGCVLIMFANR